MFGKKLAAKIEEMQRKYKVEVSTRGVYRARGELSEWSICRKVRQKRKI